jgi:CRP/FNR family cyclic AMP-dependent transcriptional regulator
VLIDYLKNVPLFKHLRDAQLKEIAARCTTAKYGKGAVVFEKSDPSTEMYIVNSGRLKAMLSGEEGDEMVLAHFEKGAFFGELNLLDGRGRTATVVADKPSELSVLGKDVFFDVLYNNPRIAVELMLALADRVRKADDMIESLVFHEVGERVARTLLEDASSAPGKTGFVSAGRHTHKELAARIGSSREAVSKCMKVLAARGIVREAEGDILVARDALDRMKRAERSS